MKVLECGVRLRLYREASKLSQEELGQRAGIEQATISRIERGEMMLLSPHAPRLAEAFGIHIAELLGLSPHPPAPIGLRRIPVLDNGQIALWGLTEERDHSAASFVMGDLRHSPATFAAQISGDAMLPRFQSGSLVIVDPALTPSPGEYVMAAVERDTCFRRHRILEVGIGGENVFALVPTNRSYPTLRSDRHEIRIIGTMVEHRSFRQTPA